MTGVVMAVMSTGSRPAGVLARLNWRLTVELKSYIHLDLVYCFITASLHKCDELVASTSPVTVHFCDLSSTCAEQLLVCMVMIKK